MHRPPEPHYTFTIPSIHDDTTLNCRIYHPKSCSAGLSEHETEISWRRRGIVMAHPYAPMGGSYDDRVVGIVVEQFLKAGWIVGTFNFRGAQGSQGRTSWSGKPELDDYTSFAACFMHYMSYIEPSPAQSPLLGADLSLEAIPTGQAISTAVHERKDSPVIILGGYSYGSLVLKNLPPVPTILQPFASPLPGSAADEILLRAHKLADQSNQEWANLACAEVQAKKRGRKAHDAKPSLTMGGEETSPEKRRSSRDVRRSLEGGASLRIKTRLRSLSHRGREDGSPATPPEEPKGHNIVVPEVRYLLISPLTPPISTLAAPALGHKFWHKSRDGAQDVVGMHPSLAIYGDQDMFTSAKKVRDWVEHLNRASASQVVGVEVPGAGHFWHEHGAEEQLIDALVNWEHSVR